MQFMTLNRNAVIIAILMGIMMFIAGGYLGPFFLLLMVYFVFVSGAVTYMKKSRKKRMGLYQEARGPKNVIANGLMPLVFALGVLVARLSGLDSLVLVMLVGFISSVASVTADKFSSEVGVLGGRPIELFSFKKVRRGRSGAVTPLGIIAGFIGAFVIGVTVFLVPANGGSIIGTGSLMVFNGPEAGVIAVIVTFAGLVGTIVDSVFGYFEERGYGNKYTSNFICSVIGSAIGMALYIAIV